ncbi:hypothetical protein BGX30_006315, partial [Mortierella sp. GBA39]
MIHRLPDERIRVLAVPAKIQVERLMIDACAEIRDLLFRRPDPPGQHRCRSLHAVAQTCHGHVCFALHRPAQHRHRIRIIQKYRLRTVSLDIAANVQHHRNRAERPEYAGWPARISDINIYAILFRNLDVFPPYVQASRQDRADDPVRPVERSDPVGMRLDFRRIASGRNDFLHRLLRKSEALLVNVNQSDDAVSECRERKQVANEVFREHETACPDKYDLLHCRIPPFDQAACGQNPGQSA